MVATTFNAKGTAIPNQCISKVKSIKVCRYNNSVFKSYFEEKVEASTCKRKNAHDSEKLVDFSEDTKSEQTNSAWVDNTLDKSSLDLDFNKTQNDNLFLSRTRCKNLLSPDEVSEKNTNTRPYKSNCTSNTMQPLSSLPSNILKDSAYIMHSCDSHYNVINDKCRKLNFRKESGFEVNDCGDDRLEDKPCYNEEEYKVPKYTTLFNIGDNSILKNGCYKLNQAKCLPKPTNRFSSHIQEMSQKSSQGVLAKEADDALNTFCETRTVFSERKRKSNVMVLPVVMLCLSYLMSGNYMLTSLIPLTVASSVNDCRGVQYAYLAKGLDLKDVPRQPRQGKLK